MKKTLIALLALAGVAVAGTNEEVITLQPAQTACTWQPEISVDYIYSAAEDSEGTDTQGARINFSVIRNTNTAFSHQFSLNASHTYGDTADTMGGYYIEAEGTESTITLGYDLNYAITDKFSVFVGAKAGYVTTDIDVKAPALNLKVSDKMEGFTYFVGGGVKYQITESINVKAGYEFNRSFMGHQSGNSVIVNGNVFSVGVGYQF